MVPGEINIANNVYIDGAVKVKMQGDMNGDGRIDILDLSMVAISFGYFSSEPEYNPEVDLNKDGIVDIYDISVVSMHYGETCL